MSESKDQMSGVVARVVPDLPSFAIDEGFAYRVPDQLVDHVGVGSVVRVPLSGRKLRGYVVELRQGPTSGLKDVLAVSGSGPIFTEELLSTLRWAARHYVAPLSVLLAKPGPPNLPRDVAELALPSIPPTTSPAPEISSAAASGTKLAAAQILAADDWAGLVRGLVTEPLAAARSALVIAPTVREVEHLGEQLTRDLGRRVVVAGQGSDAALTTAWSRMASHPGGLVLVGTPRCAWWPVASLAIVVVVDGGRRGMKDRQTPVVSAPRVLQARSRIERFNLVHVGRVPTTEVLAAGVTMISPTTRLWPLVEVIDRTEEPPGGGVVTQRARRAVAGAVRSGQRVFVFTHRHGYAPASRCVSCRLLRTCSGCEARPDPGTSCRRCGSELGPCPACGGGRFEPLGAAVGRVLEELRRVVGRAVGDAQSGAQVLVGTERDLVNVDPVGLALAVDADGLTHGTNYRAGEDAIALLARVAGLVVSGQGHRLVVQTAEPGHPVFGALRRGDPLDYLKAEVETRRSLALPPIGDVVVLEISGAVDHDLVAEAFEGVTVFGPAVVRDTARWLVQGNDLGSAKDKLRGIVGRIRDGGARVRVDVDPRDL